MVFHSSSASLSSFHFSHTSSSSPSSPPSSPDSAPSSSQDSFGPSSASSRLALVPILWEEKPGVLKKDMRNGEGDHVPNCGEDSPSGGHTPLSCDVHACTHTGDSNAHSSERLSRTFSAPRSKIRSGSVPRLRPPPRLSQPSVHACVHADDDADMLQHHHHCATSAGVRSKVMSSFSFHKRRHHRTPSLEDDPFWMAMVACTNDASKGSRMRRKGDRDATSGEMQRSDSGLVKRVQGHTIHFEQCMPRHTLTGCAISNRGKSLAPSHLGNLENEAASPKGGIKSTNRDTTHAHDQHDCTDTGARSAHLASKAFKALNIAKSELHGRCKVLLQQQSSPVDISCSTRLSKKPSFASKRKLPDLFGCKSDHPLIIP